jgi:folylpolyglutamate synthase/dihydropteroate synthase
LALANKEDLILVTGSLFVVGDAIKHLKHQLDTRTLSECQVRGMMV